MSDKKFIDGLFVKRPHDNAPDFVVAAGSINLPKFAAFLREWKATNPGKEYLNFQVKRSREGNFYADEDTWEPKKGAPKSEDFDDDLPF